MNWEERKPSYEMEQQIRSEKLAAGIGGLEWLVMNTLATSEKQESLESWLFFLRMHKYHDIEQVMRDAIKLNDKKFYRKYKCNWWISIDETITYLSLLKDRNYDRYFNFIQTLH